VLTKQEIYFKLQQQFFMGKLALQYMQIYKILDAKFKFQLTQINRQTFHTNKNVNNTTVGNNMINENDM